DYYCYSTDSSRSHRVF
nr:immunoglobulin light chain junction region [Macaca mulatta]